MERQTEVGDVLLQPDNGTWWLIYTLNPRPMGECINSGDSNAYAVGVRAMPFSHNYSDHGCKPVPIEDVPEHLLPRIATLKLLGREL